MTLADFAPPGTCRVLAAAENAGEMQSRLYALGIFPGVEVEVIRYAPLGDPIQVKVGNALLSVRRTEALLIEVQDLT